MVLGALFSFAYGESLLRSVRKRRGTVRSGELVGMAAVGAVLGGVITVAGWIAGNVPAALGVRGVVFCLPGPERRSRVPISNSRAASVIVRPS